MELMLNRDWKLVEAPLHWQADRLPLVLARLPEALPCSLPCDVRMPLMEAGRVGDPVVGDRYEQSRWVEQRSWWFVRDFDWDGGDWDRVELTLDRLDFGADIALNGLPLGRHDSVHFPFVCDVRHALRPGANRLTVRLTCGLERVSDEDLASIDWAVCTEESNGCPERGDRRRAFLRKPQYTVGWDWGPRCVTCGMGSATLRGFRRVAVRHATFATTGLREGNATVRVDAEVESLLPIATQDGDVEATLALEGRVVARAQARDALLQSGVNYFSFALAVEDARLWWPNGYGAQPLYTLTVTARAGGAVETLTKTVGIRTLALDTARIDEDNRWFRFVVNGVPVQAKGGNWIPSDSLYQRIADGKYETLVREAAEAHFTMLRVWGGGLYEREIFYDLCDRLGILVWQDYMFGCSLVPDHREDFRTLVERELTHQTRRLTSHASLAVLCGNNENQQIFLPYGENLGGLWVYNQLAPAVVRRFAPHVPYWASSPYGGPDANSHDVGDRHHWGDCMMNPEMERRITPEEYDAVSSKFVSEYGYPGPCAIESIREYFGGEEIDRDGTIWDLHNNTFEKHTVAAGIAKHYTDPEGLSLADYLRYASAVQALMLGYSLEALRSHRDCWGSLFWMYNDCWGETGWTIVDYYLRRKPSYYAVRRAFAPRKLTIRAEGNEAFVVGQNETAEPLRLTVEYGYTSFDGEERETETREVVLPPFHKAEVLRFPLGGRDARDGLWFARAEGVETVTLHRLPRRQLGAGQGDVVVTDQRDNGADLVFTVRAQSWAHHVHFGFGGDVVTSDEYFDLLPGESRTVLAKGAAGRTVDVRCL